MVSKLLVFLMLVITLSTAASVAADGAVVGAKDPKTARAIAALLATKKLECKDFATVGAPGSGDTASTAPSELQALLSIVGRASVGTCTINGQQTALVAFKSGKTRRQFEGTIRSFPCPIVRAMLGRFTPSTTQGSASSSATLSIPITEVGSRGVVFSTGTAPNSERLDLVAAAATDANIAAKVKGKVRTFTFECS
jgi:hypothetical protein